MPSPLRCVPHGHTAPRLQVCWTAFWPSSTTAAHMASPWPVICELSWPGLQGLHDSRGWSLSAPDLGSAMGACKYNGCDSESPTTPARCTVQRFNAQAFRRFGNGAREGGGVQVSRCPEMPLSLSAGSHPSDSPAGQWP